jgi:hypothetical protein
MPEPQNWTPDLSQPMPGADAALASGWSWKAAREASDRHKRGDFYLSWQLTLDAPSSPAVRAAEWQRLSVPCGLPWEIVGPTRAPARFETEASRSLWDQHLRRLLRSTLRDVAYMGLSVWQHPSAVNPTTLRREITTVERWPLSQVRYTAVPFLDPWEPGRWIFGYYAIQFGVGESMGEVLFKMSPDPASLAGSGVKVRFIQLPRPGETDGHWTMIGEGDQPHMSGAITSLDTPYVAGQLSARARANLTKQLGRQAPIYEMPKDVQPTEDTPEGKAAVAVVNGIGINREGGILPHGGKLSGFPLVTPTASFFFEDAQLTERSVAYALLGRGGTLAKEDAQYPSPVEAEVPEALVRADVRVIEIGAGVLMNALAGQNTPGAAKIELRSNLPDTEQDERRKAAQDRDLAEGKKWAAFHNAVAIERDNGFDFPPTPEGQARLDHIGKTCGVVAPKIPPEGLPPPLVKLPKPTVPITGQDEQPMPPPSGPAKASGRSDTSSGAPPAAGPA